MIGQKTDNDLHNWRVASAASGTSTLMCWLCAFKDLKMDNWTDVSEKMPPDETPVLAAVHGYDYPLVLELRWETPTHEETFTAFRYWDDPVDDGKDFEDNVFAWQPLPGMPTIDA